MRNWLKLTVLCMAAFATVAFAAGPQIREVIRVIGVGAAVRQFGPEINNQFNRLTGHRNTDTNYTKVVPIITIGVGERSAIGAAQVMGARRNVERVQAVASPQVELFGEVQLRALIPVDDIDITRPGDIKPVPGVGVSGIVDLNL